MIVFNTRLIHIINTITKDMEPLIKLQFLPQQKSSVVFVVRLQAKCAVVCSMMSNFRQVNPTQPNPKSRYQVDGSWRPRRLVNYKHNRRHWFYFDKPARQPLYILTLIDCFTRFAIAVPFVDQSAEVVNVSVFGHYITMYGTPHRILTYQGRNFKWEQLSKFCSLFRIL